MTIGNPLVFIKRFHQISAVLDDTLSLGMEVLFDHPSMIKAQICFPLLIQFRSYGIFYQRISV